MDLKTLESFKLSDAVTFHDELNPNLFQDDQLLPEVREQLLIIASDFVIELGIKEFNIQDITLTGSNAAYSYTPHSDLDLHILVDMTMLPNDEIYQELFHAKKTIYNDSHDITVHGIPVELYVEDAAQPVVSLGEYSVLNDEWLRVPAKRRANLDQTTTKAKYNKLFDIIQMVLKTDKLDKVTNLLTTIKRYRQAGLDKGGEFGPENLAYKILRKQGYIDKLYQLRNKLHSQTLSIEEDTHTFGGQDPRSFKSPNGGTPVSMIVTGQGSRYIIASDGMVLRLKSFHANTGGEDQGLKDWMQRIEFYDPADLPGGTTFPMAVAKAVEKRLPVSLSKTQDGKRALLIYKNNQWQTAKISDVFKNVATQDALIVSNFSTVPKLNWNPMDYNLSANKTLASVHPGSPVTHGVALNESVTNSLNWNFKKCTLSESKLREYFYKKAEEDWEKYGIKKIFHMGDNLARLERVDESSTSPQIEELLDFQKEILRYDMRSKIKPAIGSKVSIIQARPHIAEKIIELRGNLDPKTIEKVVYDNEHIAWLEFTDGTTFPDKSLYDMGYGNDFERLVTLIFPSRNDAEGALTFIHLQKPKGWEIGCASLGESPISDKDAFFFERTKIKEASGYIPSEKEKNDPRYKTALTVDVKPDSIQKNAKAFGFKTTRAGIPPTLRK